MAKRTHSLKYSNRDRILGLQRQFLASTQDFADLRYEYTSQSNGDDEPTETTPISSGESQPATPKPLAAPAAITSSAERIAATSIADVPIPPLEIVSALVAYKLKKTIDQVARSKSIKELSGGKIIHIFPTYSNAYIF